MSTWHIGESVVVHSGGTVDGTDGESGALRAALKSGIVHLHDVALGVGAPVSSDWSLDRYLRSWAREAGLDISTDYSPRDEDRPPEVVDAIDRANRARGAFQRGRLY
jgi:hypothetical protein